MAEIEANFWKNNIKHGMREKKDFLDTTNEDFGKHKSLGIDGKEFTPSSFNIFRDSLRKTSDKLTETLNQNLPDMNLAEISESESEMDDAVLPLDFRTALLENENRVVIQAKPLEYGKEESKKQAVDPGADLDSYLEMVRFEPFKENEGAILIDPDINIKEKFDKIDLPCNQENRLNNTFNAPVKRDPSSKRRAPRLPKRNKKQFESDTDPAASDKEEAKIQPMSIKEQTQKFK